METEKDPIDETFRLGEEWFRLAFDNAPIGMAIVGLDFRLQRVNKSLCRELGFSESELLSRSFVDITHPDDVDRDVELAKQLFRGEIPRYRLDKRFITKDAQLVWLDLTALVVRGQDHEILYGLALVDNITARKQTEEALRQSEERYRSFIVNSSEGIWRYETKRLIDTSLPADEQIKLFREHAYLAECNDIVARMYGRSRSEEVVGMDIKNLHSASDPVNIDSARAFIANGYRFHNLESVGIDSEGRKKYFLNNLTGIVQNGLLLRVWGTRQDITERKNAEDQIKYSRQQLRALAARLQSLREKERADIAREIHDVLGQGLTGLKIDISWLNKKLPEASDESVRARMAEKLKESIELLDETLVFVKNLSTELRPGVLDTFGLVAAIEWQCQEFEKRTGIVCECRLPEDDAPLSAECSTALFRILQESLTNVARHSQAKKVRVEVTVDEGLVSLSVEDDGRGITDDEIEAPTSLGFLGMRERAAPLGGDIIIKGVKGKGTKITIHIPLDASKQNDDGKA